MEPSFWLARTGCQWRHLTDRFPDWQAVRSQWRRWRDSATWAAAMRVLSREVRLAQPQGRPDDGDDRRPGRKGWSGRGGYTRGAARTILIEILGLPLAVSVESGQAAPRLLGPQVPQGADRPQARRAAWAPGDRGRPWIGGLAALAASHGLNLDIKVPPAPPMLPPSQARRQDAPGSACLHADPAAVQGRERLRPPPDVAAAVAVLRADRARGPDLDGGRLRRLPLRQAAGGANASGGRR